MPTKLAAVLTVPLLGFLVLSGVQIAESVRTAAGLGGFSDQVALGVEVTELVHELQRERDRTVGVLASLTVPGPGRRDFGTLAPDRTAVDRAAVRLREAARPLLDDPALTATWRQAQTRLDQLAAVRAGAEQGWLRTQAVFDTYSAAVADLLALLPAPVDVGGDAGLGRSLRGLADLARAKELAAQIRGQLYLLCYGASPEPGAFGQVTDLRAQSQTAMRRFRAEAPPWQVARFDDTVTGQAVRNAERLERLIAEGGAAGVHSVEPQQWWSASTTELQLMRTLEQAVRRTAVAAVDAASTAQWRTTGLRSLATAGLLLAALLLSVAIGRNMAFSLRSLRTQALVVADVKLPHMIEQLRRSPTTPPPLRVDPVLVGSRDEVAEVAEAFTAVHRSAVRLAAEQAGMRRNVNEIFVKLALRSQSLVERQLQMLDTMEQAEVDPDKLAALFRLDHLVARLRRNDENLLVLAGGDSSRRWNQPKDLHTIVLAAAAEVEHYERVSHELDAGVSVVGHAVADVVNLLAELLENGLAFSPPRTQVRVRGYALADGSAELTVTDEGLGMSEQALAEANKQVSAPVAIDISAAERMGLVVVGHLASRHGITVHLDSGERGVTVSVGIPAALIAAEPEPAPAPSHTGAGEAGAVPPSLRRPAPTRAEDVLAPGSRPASIWWSRDAAAQAAPATAQAAPATAPAAQAASATEPVPPTGPAEAVPQASSGEAAAVQAPAPPALTEAGLPMRVRSSLPGDRRPRIAAALPETDPDTVGDTLTRLYQGLRRAEAEEAEAGQEPEDGSGPAPDRQPQTVDAAGRPSN